MRLSSLIANASPVAGIIISVALMLFSGFAMTRLTKLARLPNVTGYILAGILIGPHVLNLVPQRIIDGTDFLSDIALAFIAFSTGEFFKLPVLKKSGMKVVWITVFEAVLASVFIFILTYFILRLELAFSIVLAALASATAPASTMMTIRQTGAKGDFVDTLLQVVALDDVVGLVLYSIAISIALASLSGVSGFSFETLGNPVLLNLLVLLLGSIYGLFMKLLMHICCAPCANMPIDALRADGAAFRCDDDQIRATVADTFARTGYLLDPHGACGYRALRDGLRDGATGIFLEPAHPAKFRVRVEPVIGRSIEFPARLAEFMRGKKLSVELPADFGAFRDFLMAK